MSQFISYYWILRKDREKICAKFFPALGSLYFLFYTIEPARVSYPRAPAKDSSPRDPARGASPRDPARGASPRKGSLSQSPRKGFLSPQGVPLPEPPQGTAPIPPEVAPPIHRPLNYMPPSDRRDQAHPHQDDQVESRFPKITKSRSSKRSRPFKANWPPETSSPLHTKMIKSSPDAPR